MTVIDEGIPMVRWFRDIGNSDRESVGGKGASLGELERAGIRVPAGFVITTAAFQFAAASFDPGGNWRAKIEALSADDLGNIAAVGRPLRERVRNNRLPPAIERHVTDAWCTLCNGEPLPVAVRSSATAEDGDAASFAGLQETLLWVRGRDDLLAAVRSCWASLYSDESIAYRRRLNLREEEMAMGVVVQAMVNARSAGVMFTRGPATGDRSVIAIEAAWGLGSALVSGEVTPDQFTVGKVSGEISKRVISSKHLRHVPSTEGSGVSIEEVPAIQRDAPCLDEHHIKILRKLARRAEALYGVPVDIEWAIDQSSGVVYLLQCRPETVWSLRDKSSPASTAPARSAFDCVMNTYLGRAASGVVTSKVTE